MVVVCPLCKVIGKFESGHVGSSILKVDDDQLLVFIGCLE